MCFTEYMNITLLLIISMLVNVVLGLFVWTIMRENRVCGERILAYHRLTLSLASCLEMYIVNDVSRDNLGKRPVFDDIMTNIARLGRSIGEFPDQIKTLTKSIYEWMERELVASTK